jgi:hypothetical protein
MDFVSWNYDYSQLNGQFYQMFKNMKVGWDDDIPNIWKNKIHVPNRSSVGMMTFLYGKSFTTCSIHVPNHQPDEYHIPIVVGL